MMDRSDDGGADDGSRSRIRAPLQPRSLFNVTISSLIDGGNHSLSLRDESLRDENNTIASNSSLIDGAGNHSLSLRDESLREE